MDVIRNLDSEVREIAEKLAAASRYHKIEIDDIILLVREQLDNRDTYDDNLNLIEF